jgi:hypothetical protein
VASRRNARQPSPVSAGLRPPNIGQPGYAEVSTGPTGAADISPVEPTGISERNMNKSDCSTQHIEPVGPKHRWRRPRTWSFL